MTVATQNEQVIAVGQSQVTILTSPEDRTFILEEKAKLILVCVFSDWDDSVHNLQIKLLGADAVASVVGFFVGIGEQVFRSYLTLDLQAPATKAHALFRGLLQDRSKVDFHGNIHIAANAEQADAYLTHNTLLLSPQAHATSTPALEILANDVKAGHASTTGTLDPESLFYLLSRGLTREQAKETLIQAFLNEAFIRIPDQSAREAAEVLVAQALNPEKSFGQGSCCGRGCCGSDKGTQI